LSNSQLELGSDGRVRITGSLGFTTVSALLATGTDAILTGRAAVIDLGAVTASDSSGLALLIEWLSIAKQGSPSSTRTFPGSLCSSLA
jgi:phospholipid transport system transporter-binding protein